MINRATIPALIRPLLSCGALARAPGAEGQLSYRFPYPAHLVVTVSRTPASPPRNANPF